LDLLKYFKQNLAVAIGPGSLQLALLLQGYKETVSEMHYLLRSSCARNQRSTCVH
jgi:hypothetical protein